MMSANDEQKKGQPEQQTKKTEISSLSRWLIRHISKRGPKFLGPITRMGDRSIKRIEPFIEKGHVVADLGCGWGYYSFVLAEVVGIEGKVFSVDIDPKVITAIQKKIEARGHHNMEAHAASAADLNFMKDRSVDFIFANGLLCSMTADRSAAVAEMKRILKPSGHAYISLGAAPPWGYVDEAEWVLILQGFIVDQGGTFREKWVLVSQHLA